MKETPPPSWTEAELKEQALETMQSAKFPMLATLDKEQPRLRPVSPLRSDGFVIYIANLRRYHKTGEIALNPRVELCYLAANHDQVRITGIAEPVTDETTLLDLWGANPLLRQYLGSLHNPELIIYRIAPSRVRFMREWALDYHEIPLPPRDEEASTQPS